MRTKIGFFTVKIVCLAFILGALLVPLQTEFARGAEGITLEKDVFLQYPILGVEDLPDEITFALYASASATTPLATQAFPRGKYTLDFEFNKSDGVYLAPIARLKVDFTGKLNMGDDPDNPTRVREIWSEVQVNGQSVGDRTRVTDEAMVKLLLASDASIATYLTLVYEGDNNPIATIYRELPLSLNASASSGTSARDYINSLFVPHSGTGVISPINDSPLSTETPQPPTEYTPRPSDSSGLTIVSSGYVGIGTSSPGARLHILGSSNFPTVDEPPILKVESSGGNQTPLLLTAGTGNAYVKGDAWGNMAMGAEGFIAYEAGGFGAANEKMRVTADGKVGIGTTSPSYTLHVNGTAAGTSWTNLSSREYKENIKVVDESEHPMMLAKLMDLDLTTYKYKQAYGGDNTTKLGFIAEDMPKNVLSKDGKGVDVYELIAFTIGAMKAQQKKIAELEAQINKLQHRHGE